MEAGAASIGEALAGTENAAADPHLVVTKSTVVPNTTEDRLAPRIADAGLERGADCLVASDPEFLREGTAVADVLNPDKLVVGRTTTALRRCRDFRPARRTRREPTRRQDRHQRSRDDKVRQQRLPRVED